MNRQIVDHEAFQKASKSTTSFSESLFSNQVFAVNSETTVVIGGSCCRIATRRGDFLQPHFKTGARFPLTPDATSGPGGKVCRLCGNSGPSTFGTACQFRGDCGVL